jgi:hypothetical protein
MQPKSNGTAANKRKIQEFGINIQLKNDGTAYENIFSTAKLSHRKL